MQMQPLSSSNIKAIGWQNHTLTVDFHNGRRYNYAPVEESVFSDWLAAPSAGKFFHAEVKDRYEFTQEPAVHEEGA